MQSPGTELWDKREGDWEAYETVDWEINDDNDMKVDNDSIVTKVGDRFLGDEEMEL